MTRNVGSDNMLGPLTAGDIVECEAWKMAKTSHLTKLEDLWVQVRVGTEVNQNSKTRPDAGREIEKE
jgi:hypothetical protein